MGTELIRTRPPVGVARDTFRNVVAAAYMAYQLHNQDPKNRKPDGAKTLPTIEEINVYCRHTKDTIAKVVGTDEFLYAMREKGVYWDAKEGLSPEQIYCIGIMTDPSHRGSLADKLRKAGITMQTYKSWLRQPLFARAIKQVGENMLGDHLADINTAVVSSAIHGNMKAVEIYHQMTGQHDPNKQRVEDLQQMISMLLDTIFRHVRDTATLEAITKDFDTVLSGKKIEADLIMDADVVDDELVPSSGERPPAITELDLPEDPDLPPNFYDFQPEIEEL